MVDSENSRKPRRTAKYWTPKFIEALRPEEQAYEIADPQTPGLRLRVAPTGKKTFRWYVSSLKKVVTIGPWAMVDTPAHVTLKQARDALHELKAARMAGVDELNTVIARLGGQRRPRPPAPREATGDTVEAVAERFLKMLDGQRKRPEMARYVVNKDILPVIGAMQLRSIKKSDCRAVISKVTARGSKVHAGKVLGLLKQLLDYAENVEDDFVNPAARLKAANLEIEHNVRDRWLSEKEIPLFWAALDDEDSGLEEKTAAALRLLLLTGARSGELRLAQWADVKLEPAAEATWTIPVANQKLSPRHAKQAKAFVIPLSPTAVALFHELKEMAGDSRWVLASEEAHEGHFAEKSLGKAQRRMWRRHPELKKLPEAAPHDLRRTARTWLGKLGIAPHIAERCLNHSLGRITKTYDQGDYLSERRAAMEKWDAFLQRLVNPEESNVAFLPAVAQ